MVGQAPDNLPFIFAAFAVVWAVFLGYAVYMSWRRQALQRELRELRGGGDGDGDERWRGGIVRESPGRRRWGR